ncbi:MAG TPA: DUF5655 domain-containing protein [Candidatus Sulfotelmatobacter sp.]|nr:DUF5655 domain-containing protein [Candidatus Sulfotelmatobacter sp.]
MPARAVKKRPLWRCPDCGHWFVTRNLWHSCERVPVSAHFAGRPPALRQAWRAFVAAAREGGPVRLSPNRTRIAIMARMRFASAVVRKGYLLCTFILARRVADPRIVKYEFLKPRYHLHTFRLERPDQVDAQVRRWLAEAYRFGKQEPVGS